MTRAVLLAAGLLAGCNTYNIHGWSKPLPLATGAERVPVASLSGLKAGEVADAAALLEGVDLVELTATDAARLAHKAPDPAPGEKLFLLRGLSWYSHPPHFRNVYIDRVTRTVYVIGYVWGGEIFIPFMPHDQVASPVIASLPFTPAEVVPRAVLGGDRIMGYRDRDSLDELDRGTRPDPG